VPPASWLFSSAPQLLESCGVSSSNFGGLHTIVGIVRDKLQ
jgi:hypothetical protein